MENKAKYPILVFILRFWKINIVTLFTVGIGILVLVFFVLEKKYTADVSIIPSAADFSAGIGGNLGSLAGMAGIDLSMTTGQSQEMYEGILTSRQLISRILYDTFTVKDEFDNVAKVKLIDYLDIDFENENEKLGTALKQFKEEVIAIGINPENKILTLSVTLPDPNIASDVANRMVNVLDDIVQNQVQKEYYEQYEYLTKRIEETQKNILAAESDLEKFLEKTSGFMEPSAQILELRYRRNLEVQTAIFLELTKQKEMFILQNMINLNPVKVLDHAIPPYRKSQPKRILLTISLGFLWLCFQIGINTIIVFYKKIKSDLVSNISNK